MKKGTGLPLNTDKVKVRTNPVTKSVKFADLVDGYYLDYDNDLVIATENDVVSAVTLQVLDYEEGDYFTPVKVEIIATPYMGE